MFQHFCVELPHSYRVQISAATNLYYNSKICVIQAVTLIACNFPCAIAMATVNEKKVIIFQFFKNFSDIRMKNVQKRTLSISTKFITQQSIIPFSLEKKKKHLITNFYVTTSFRFFFHEKIVKNSIKKKSWLFCCFL